MTKSGKRKRQTVTGWFLKVRWKDKSEHWLPLSLLKESNPVDVADYAKASGIADEPAFDWWVPYTLKKREAIVSAVNARLRKTTHKYGIEVPRTVEHTYKLDQRNKNTYGVTQLQRKCFKSELLLRSCRKANKLRLDGTR